MTAIPGPNAPAPAETISDDIDVITALTVAAFTNPDEPCNTGRGMPPCGHPAVWAAWLTDDHGHAEAPCLRAICHHHYTLIMQGKALCDGWLGGEIVPVRAITATPLTRGGGV